MGCEIGSLPSIYLRLPLGQKPPDSFWNGILDRFNKKLAGWKGATLSQVGKFLLVKSTQQNLPTYALSLFVIPSKFGPDWKIIKYIIWWLGIKFVFLNVMVD